MTVEKLGKRTSTFHLVLMICAGVAMISGRAGAQSSSDEVLEERVESALENASDLPVDSITVEVRGGVVTLTGSVACEECGGSRTPAGVGTVQQSLGAVVRAVPGVERVEFKLQYQPPADRSGGRGG